MSAARVAELNEFAQNEHPGMVGVEVLSCEPELVTGRLPVTEAVGSGTSSWPALVCARKHEVYNWRSPQANLPLL